MVVPLGTIGWLFGLTLSHETTRETVLAFGISVFVSTDFLGTSNILHG